MHHFLPVDKLPLQKLGPNQLWQLITQAAAENFVVGHLKSRVTCAYMLVQCQHYSSKRNEHLQTSKTIGLSPPIDSTTFYCKFCQFVPSTHKAFDLGL